MKTTILLLSCLLGFSLVAAEPSKPATFEVRLVLDKATDDSEQLTVLQQSTVPKQAEPERLHVQKKALLARADLKSADVHKSKVNGAPEIQIAFSEQGTKRFAEVTRKHVGERLAIVIDGKVYSAPVVRTEIPGGKAVISGSFSQEEATQLVSRLNEKPVK